MLANKGLFGREQAQKYLICYLVGVLILICFEVAGGEAVGRRGRKIYLDDTEVFNGKKWVKSRVKLDKPRSGFSLVKIPKKRRKNGRRRL